VKRNTIHTVTVDQAKTRKTGDLITDATAIVKVKVYDRSGAVTQAETPMVYQAAGVWELDIPAVAFVAGADPWTVEVVIYDQAGITPRDTMRFTEKDEIAR
jgi:hypothetical protein